MLLENKVAVIYGAGGSIGGAVARTFAREGARVFLAGRTRATLEAVAGDIRAHGGAVDVATVDALDEGAVNDFVDTVVDAAGGDRYLIQPDRLRRCAAAAAGDLGQ